MSEDAYKGLDDLRVNPFIAPKQEPKAVANFKCPICGETVQMIFSRDDLKQLMKGISDAYSARAIERTRRPPR